jgi:hypothetical protein
MQRLSINDSTACRLSARDIGVNHLCYNCNSESPEMAYRPCQKWIQICLRRVQTGLTISTWLHFIQMTVSFPNSMPKAAIYISRSVAEEADKTAIVAENISGSQISHINSHPTLNWNDWKNTYKGIQLSVLIYARDLSHKDLSRRSKYVAWIRSGQTNMALIVIKWTAIEGLDERTIWLGIESIIHNIRAFEAD